MTLPIVERFSNEIMLMAKAYELGSPESRAIVTALDHARAVVRSDRLHEEIVDALEFYGAGIGFTEREDGGAIARAVLAKIGGDS